MWFSPGQPGPRKQMSLVRGRAAGNLDATGAGLKGQTARALRRETVATGPGAGPDAQPRAAHGSPSPGVTPSLSDSAAGFARLDRATYGCGGL